VGYRSAAAVAAGGGDEDAAASYGALKRGAPEGYWRARRALLNPPSPFADWTAKPAVEQDFC
jgi:hypothetical protein